MKLIRSDYSSDSSSSKLVENPYIDAILFDAGLDIKELMAAWLQLSGGGTLLEPDNEADRPRFSALKRNALSGDPESFGMASKKLEHDRYELG